MSYQIIFHPQAEKEYAKALKWYEQARAGLAKRFKHAVSVQLNYITSSPEVYPVKKGKFRESVVAVFPYIIIFAIYPQENLIYVYSVFHTSRHPAKKYSRKRTS